MPKCFDNFIGWKMDVEKMDVEYVLILAINKTIYYSQEGELTAGVKTES